MTRHWTVSINGAAPVHLTLAEYADAVERARRGSERVDIAIVDAAVMKSSRMAT